MGVIGLLQYLFNVLLPLSLQWCFIFLTILFPTGVWRALQSFYNLPSLLYAAAFQYLFSFPPLL